MSDRTQTLLVELTREEIDRLDLCIGAGLSEDTVEHPAPFALKTARKKLKAALSQPEHQGDEESKTCSFCGSGCIGRVHDAATPTFRCQGCGATWSPEPAQPPAPVLSDEGRALLIELAIEIEKRFAGYDHLPPSKKRLVDILRNLASQEHRGEEGRIAKLEALEPGWDSYGGKTPTRAALERLRGFDRALAYVPLADGGVQVEFHALGLDFEAEIDPAGEVTDVDLQPPAGEVERLRELEALSAWIADNTESSKRIREDASEQDRTRLTGIIDAYSYVQDRIDLLRRSAPSDSQGDQERCPRCNNPGTPRGDTREGTAWNCEHCQLPFQVIDSGAPRHVLETPSARAAGDDPDTARQEAEQGDECPKSPDGCHDFEDHGGGVIRCMSCGLPGPEGGDEEDWPEVWMRLTGPGKTVHCDPACASQSDVRRYVPATSQDSDDDLASMVVATGAAFKPERDRAKKAEAERDKRGHELAMMDYERAKEMDRAERYESALEELAEDFDQRAEEVLEARDRRENTRCGEAFGLRQAALLAREKAAKLKEER